jgi:hypothetical protein
MRRTRLTVTLALAAAASLLLSDGTSGAKEAGGRERNPQTAERDVKTLSTEELREAYMGVWNDERHRWWFTITDIENNKIKGAQFRLASLKEGTINGDKLTMVSRECVIFIGCYEYRIKGTLLTPTNMDMYGTSDNNETVHFRLIRQLVHARPPALQAEE